MRMGFGGQSKQLRRAHFGRVRGSRDWPFYIRHPSLVSSVQGQRTPRRNAMSKEWPLLLGMISVLCLSPQRASAGPTTMSSLVDGPRSSEPLTATDNDQAQVQEEPTTVSGTDDQPGSTEITGTTDAGGSSIFSIVFSVLSGVALAPFRLALNTATAPLQLTWDAIGIFLFIVRRILVLVTGLGSGFLGVAVSGVWGILRNTLLPVLDAVFARLASSALLPSNLKEGLQILHSAYQFLKYCGFA